MSNKEIVTKLKLTIKYMELHGMDEHKIRGYQNAIQVLERIHEPFTNLNENQLQEIDGIGKSIATTINEIATAGTSEILEKYAQDTPAGLRELMRFRGIGIKRLKTLWLDFGITDKFLLKALVQSGKLLSVKGFGEKTIANLAAVIDYAIDCEGKIYYADAEKMSVSIMTIIAKSFPSAQMSTVGKLRRKWAVIDAVEILIDVPLTKLVGILDKIEFVEQDKKKSGPFSWKGRTIGDLSAEVIFYPTTPEKFINNLLLKTGSPEHLNWLVAGKKFKDHINSKSWASEEECYSAVGLAFTAPEIREGDWEMELALKKELPELLNLEDLKGILHLHTTYSDGQNTVAEMAEACQQKGYQYLGITDHSKAASFYANGMFEERVLKQQAEIDNLNKEAKLCKIFKGIEADILADGALDYDNELLSTFDFVVASIHSGLNMDKVKATERLITAIANPYTTFLGHMTGRILLQRQGYPVDHEAIINACAEFKVIIEINAHPKRLDIDWRWVHKALDKGLILSVNPDAHEIAGYDDMYYGVCVGRKGGLTKAQTFNTWSLEKVTAYFTDRKANITKS
jgi:DNA polymerase (family X)